MMNTNSNLYNLLDKKLEIEKGHKYVDKILLDNGTYKYIYNDISTKTSNQYKDQGYVNINSKLRNNDTAGIKEEVAILDNLTQAPLEDKYLYRCYYSLNTPNPFENLKEGDKWSDKAYLSTSTSKKLMDKYYKFAKDTYKDYDSKLQPLHKKIFIDNSKNFLTGAKLENKRGQYKEDEVLLPRNQEFRVNKIEGDNIYLEPINNLKKSYMNPFDILQKPLIFDIEKARQAAPIGTVKEINGVKYQKTNDGWRYVKDPRQKKQEESTQQKQPKQEEQTSGKTSNGEEVKSPKVGQNIEGKGGEKGKVVEVKDGKAVISMKDENGEEKKFETPIDKLHKPEEGGDKKESTDKPETTDKKTPKEEGSTENILEHLHKEGKKASEILKHLIDSGMDEDDALDKIIEYRKGNSDKSKENKEGSGVDSAEDDDHEDHDTSITHQAENDTNHEGYRKSKTTPKEEKQEIDKLDTQTEGASVEGEVATDLKEMDKNPYIDEDDPETTKINQKFAAYARQVRSVINGSMKSCLVYGSGGVGKTFTMTQELQKAGKKPFITDIHEPGDEDYDYVKITGRVTATSFYQMLHQHPGKILLIDDCNSLLEDKNSLDMLKGMLDTSGDGTITWGSGNPPKGTDGEKLPQMLQFTGRVMFATNLPIKELSTKNKDLGAVLTRGPSMDLSMSPKQTIQRIKSIAWNPKTKKLDNLKFPGTPNYDPKDLEAAIDFLDKNKNKPGLDISIRTIGTLLGLQKEAKRDGVDWVEDAKHAVGLSKSETTTPFEVTRNRIESTYGKSNNKELLKSKISKYINQEVGSSNYIS